MCLVICQHSLEILFQSIQGGGDGGVMVHLTASSKMSPGFDPQVNQWSFCVGFACSSWIRVGILSRNFYRLAWIAHPSECECEWLCLCVSPVTDWKPAQDVTQPLI